MRPSTLLPTVVSTLTFFCTAHAISLDISDSGSIKKAAQTVANDLLGYYNGSKPGNTFGLFDDTNTNIYWWESGAIWDGLIDYWKYTGDAQYNTLVQQALLYQSGPNNDYMPPNQTKTEANGDQAVWALAAMNAAEQQLPNPTTSPSWLDLAINVFNLQVARWDTATCNGGLRWQIFSFNKGYDYKNSQSSGSFFLLAARLARYTGNQTYADWATKAYDWTTSVGLITSDYKTYDGTQVAQNCSDIDKLQWTYTAAAFVYGSALMSNHTNGSPRWQNTTQSLLSAMSIFFTPNSNPTLSDGRDYTYESNSTQNIMREIACEPQQTCNYDQFAFKGVAAQYLGSTNPLAPSTYPQISQYLQASAVGAAQSCSGGNSGTQCGSTWTTGKYDGRGGVGTELSALNIILANLASNASAPATSATKGAAGSSSASGSGSAHATSTSSSTPSDAPVSTATAMIQSKVAIAIAIFALLICI